VFVAIESRGDIAKMTTPLPMKSAAEILGARLLKDIEREEGSLESVSTIDV